MLKALRLPSWPRASLAADMRRAVSFTFYPEGYDWVEPQPTVLSEGHAGGWGAPGAQEGFAYSWDQCGFFLGTAHGAKWCKLWSVSLSRTLQNKRRALWWVVRSLASVLLT